MLYIDYFRKEMEKFSLKLSTRKKRYFTEFRKNLQEGLEYYQRLSESFAREEWGSFSDDLKSVCKALEALEPDPIVTSS